MIDKIKHILDSTSQMFINLCSGHRKNNSSNLLKKAAVEIKPPNGCSERTMKSPKMNKTITLLGTIHTGDSKNGQLNEEVNFWIKSKISDADQNTTVLLEMPKKQLNDKTQWDEREMFVAARQAAAKNFPIEATEPEQAIRELLLSKPYVSQWASFNSKTIPQEDQKPLIDAYIRNIQIIHRRLANNTPPLKT